MGKLILRNNGLETQLVNGLDFTSITPESGKYFIGVDAATGAFEKLNPDGVIVDFEEGGSGGTFTGGTVSGATIFTNGVTSNTITVETISATTYLNIPVNGGIVEVVHNELLQMRDMSGLTAGVYYLITDFKSCYDQPDFDYNDNPITGPNTYKQGPIEPLLLFAISESELSNDAFSPLYPNDKIKYDISWQFTEATSNPALGRITERIDDKNNRTDYDHRNILFKRYESYGLYNTLSGYIINVNGSIVTGYNTNFTNDLNVDDVVFIPTPNSNGDSFYRVVSITDRYTIEIEGYNYYNWNFGNDGGVNIWKCIIEGSNVAGTIYYFNDEGNNNINDGGNDMYDGGNRLDTDQYGTIPYTHTQMTGVDEEASLSNFSMDGTVQSGNGYFGSSSNYFTNYYPGLFVMVADTTDVTYFQTSGNLGADTQGSCTGYTYSTTVNGNNYTAYAKVVSEAGDPSVNHIIIVNTDGTGLNHDFSLNTDNDYDRVENLNSNGVTQIHYLLTGLANGVGITYEQIQCMVDAYLSLTDGNAISTILSNLNSNYDDVTSCLPARSIISASLNYKQPNLMSSTAYTEYKTFELVNANNVYIGDYAKYEYYGFMLSNNVFGSPLNIFDCSNSKIGDYSYNNSFGAQFYNNDLKGYAFGNIFYNSFSTNNINTYFSNNKNYGGDFYQNNIGKDYNYNSMFAEVYNNNLGNNFNENIIIGELYHNEIGDNFTNNLIYYSMYSNNIRNGFNYNRIYSDLFINDINTDFSNNYIYYPFYNNTVGSNFNNNRISNRDFIGNYNVSNNIIGDNSYNNLLHGGNFQNNVLGNGFYNNEIFGNFYSNKIGYRFYSNITYNGFYNNTIGNDTSDNSPFTNFSNNTIANNFTNNFNSLHGKWGWGNLSNVFLRDFSNWADALNNSVGETFLNLQMVMHDTINDQYYRVKFTQWTPGGNGGGFKYERTLIDSVTGSDAGATVYFTKSNYGSEVDVIVPGILEITRGNNQGIYNSAVEGGYNGLAPGNTTWNSRYTSYQSGRDFSYNTIDSSFYNNSVGNDFYFNNINGNFQSNDIGNDFKLNKIGYSFMNNIISVGFESNTVGDYFGNNNNGPGSPVLNTILSDFKYNVIGNYFGNDLNFPSNNAGTGGDGGNLVGIGFQNNIIGDNTIMNLIGSGFTGNRIGDYFSLNSFGNITQDNTIGNYFIGNGGNDGVNNGYPEQISNNFVSNKIGNYTTYNQINEFNNNIVGNYLNNNILNASLYNNLIGDNFEENTIGSNPGCSSFYRNDIGNDFNNNSVGCVDFQNNEIGNQFNNNICGGSFYKNTVLNGFNYNKLYEFSANYIGHGFNDNTIQSGFIDNTVGNYFSNNKVTTAYSNKIGNYFQNNVFGTGFGSYDLGNVTSRNYNTFRAALSYNVGSYVIGRELIMFDTVNNEYHLIIFNKWTQGGNGGGFAYTRQVIYPYYGSTVSFERPDYSPGTVDIIVPGVLEISRNDNGGGIYNSAVEGSYNNSSPANTQWNSNFLSSSTGSDFNYNIIGESFYSNIITGGWFQNNNISYNFNNNYNIGNNFRKNNIKAQISGNDFSSSNYVYNDYNCELFENSNNVKRLSYYDGNDVLNIVNITD